MSQHVTRRRAMSLVLGTWAGMVLGGCGQKGPLYFPPEEKEEEDKKKGEDEDQQEQNDRRERGPGGAESPSGESM